MQRGKTMLKVAGIMYIVHSILPVVLSVMLLRITSLLFQTKDGLMNAYGLFLAPLTIFTAIFSAGFLFCGIYALIHCGDDYMGQRLYVIGIVLLVLQILNFIAACVNGTALVYHALPLIWATLYILGAKRNRDDLLNRRVM